MTAILFTLLLIIIISVHEFGHFLAAKLFNVYVSEFSIGMGPAIKSWQGKETKYSIRAIPLGGYCAMAGDSDNPIEPTVEEKLPKERTLNGIHPVKKIIVLLAGIFMNVVLAFVIVAVIIMINGNYGVSPDNIVDERQLRCLS